MPDIMRTFLLLSLCGTVLAALLAVLRRLLKNRLPKALFYYLWLLVLLRLALPVALPVPGLELSLSEPAPAERAAQIPAGQSAPAAGEPVPFDPEGVFTLQEGAVVTGSGLPLQDETAGTAWPRQAWDWLCRHVTVLWLTGAALHFLWFALSYLRFCRTLRADCAPLLEHEQALLDHLRGKRRVSAFRSPLAATPMLVGLLRPRILLPETAVSTRELECILRHELTHLRRRDLLFKWTAVAVTSFHWFNPFMPWLRREIDRCCELSCDEGVIRTMTEGQRQAYGETLLALAALLALPTPALGEMLDLSQFAGGEPPAAEEWEDAVFDTRAWYERVDGSDWRVQEDGSVIVTISATGDVTIGGDTRKSGKSIFDKQLEKEPSGLSFPMENVADLFAADDMTIVNFEGTLTNTKSKTKNTFSFAAPPEYVQVLTSGSVEAVSLENNHILDHGEQGYADTCDALAGAGIRYSGHLGSAVYTTETGVDIGMLSYQTFNGNYKNIYASIEGDIKALRDAGCELVIVSYHWGEEKDYLPNERQVPLGRATIDAGADLVIGHHSHRMNPIEEYKGKYICYSLGNFSFAGNTRPDDMDTYIFQQRFRVYPQTGVVENEGFRIVPCSISSQEKVNDFKPTPADETHSAAIVERLLGLNKQLEKTYKSTGVTAVDDYPTEWTISY